MISSFRPCYVLEMVLCSALGVFVCDVTGGLDLDDIYIV